MTNNLSPREVLAAAEYLGDTEVDRICPQGLSNAGRAQLDTLVRRARAEMIREIEHLGYATPPRRSPRGIWRDIDGDPIYWPTHLAWIEDQFGSEAREELTALLERAGIWTEQNR